MAPPRICATCDAPEGEEVEILACDNCDEYVCSECQLFFRDAETQEDLIICPECAP